MENSLKEVHIENFRSIKNVTVPLTNRNVLVGGTGTGKTSFLEAIELVLGSQFLSNSFELHFPEKGELISVLSSKGEEIKIFEKNERIQKNERVISDDSFPIYFRTAFGFKKVSKLVWSLEKPEIEKELTTTIKLMCPFFDSFVFHYDFFVTRLNWKGKD